METTQITLETIKEDILCRLNERLNEEHYLCDIGFKLTERENTNGSWYCSTHKAKEEIKENFDLCSDFSEWHKDNFGEYKNPFTDPENFHCCMMIYAYENIFDQAVSEHKDWNSQTKITKSFIKKVKSLLENVETIF